MVNLKITLGQVPLGSLPPNFLLLVTLIYTITCGRPIIVDFFSTPLPIVIFDPTTTTFALSLSLLPTTVNIVSYFSLLMVHNTYRAWKS